ncbi:caprin-2-like [Halichoeres trimaculatus]|uniref:caprin-2-like n=1 Tax=Halichoeres trimaculatus TaxID=147232 RepID=UPI003D9ED5A2
MAFSALLSMVLFGSLALVRSDILTPETENTNEPCFPVCDLVREFSALREKVGALETKLKESENQIVELKARESTKVAFSAATGGGNNAIGPYIADTTLVFRKVHTNIGEAYDTGTGFFSAPVAGTYVFMMFHHAGGNQIAGLNLMKNNDLIIQTFDHKSTEDTADNGGNAVILQLQKGDKLCVRLSANTHVWGNDFVTTFSGYLLSQD